jgi:hypothetical protein
MSRRCAASMALRDSDDDTDLDRDHQRPDGRKHYTPPSVWPALRCWRQRATTIGPLVVVRGAITSVLNNLQRAGGSSKPSQSQTRWSHLAGWA